LPALAAVEGRVDDVLYSPDGRRVGRLDPVFKARLPIREAQIIQEALDRIRVRYVPTPDFGPEAERSIVSLIRARMGDVRVVLESADAIPRTSSGKFRSVICNLTAEQRDRPPSPPPNTVNDRDVRTTG
jgi:phenylacetate-CoA ligase